MESVYEIETTDRDPDEVAQEIRPSWPVNASRVQGLSPTSTGYDAR